MRRKRFIYKRLLFLSFIINFANVVELFYMNKFFSNDRIQTLLVLPDYGLGFQ